MSVQSVLGTEVPSAKISLLHTHSSVAGTQCTLLKSPGISFLVLLFCAKLTTKRWFFIKTLGKLCSVQLLFTSWSNNIFAGHFLFSISNCLIVVSFNRGICDMELLFLFFLPLFIFFHALWPTLNYIDGWSNVHSFIQTYAILFLTSLCMPA